MATAADIITYIGVPLAVLGVSPILYNFLIAFFVKWSIQRKISAIGLQKDVVISTRLMNGIAEVELPIYHISLDNIPPHPAGVKARASWQKKIWMNRTPNVGILSGGSWIPLTYDDDDQGNLVPSQTDLRACFKRSRTGSIKQEFKRSSEMILPAATIRFEELLKWFVLFGGELDRAGFKVLRQLRTDIPPNTRLIQLKPPANNSKTKSEKSPGALKSAIKAGSESETVNGHMFEKDTVYLCTTKSSVENLTSLTLRFENILAWLPEREQIWDPNNFLDNEMKHYVKNDRDREVLFSPHIAGTNRYFIPEAHSQAHFNPKARETTEAEAEAAGDRDFEKAQTTIKLEGKGTNTPGLILNSIVGLKKGLHIWIGPSGLSQVYLQTSTSTHSAGAGNPSHLLEIDSGILQCDLLQHALSATLELQNFANFFPTFEYEPDVLYGCLNCFIDAKFIPIAVLSALKDVLHDESVDLNGITGDHATNFTVHSEVELEGLLKSQDMRSRKKLMAANAVPLHKMGGSRIFSVLKTSPSAVKLAELRVLIDKVLWRKAASESASTHKDDWALFSYQVPTAKTILYYILTEKNFGRKVVKWLDILRASMFGDEVKVSQNMRMMNGLHFFCAVILVDDVARNVGSILHVDDVRYCLRQFGTVYLQ